MYLSNVCRNGEIGYIYNITAHHLSVPTQTQCIVSTLCTEALHYLILLEMSYFHNYFVQYLTMIGILDFKVYFNLDLSVWCVCVSWCVQVSADTYLILLEMSYFHNYFVQYLTMIGDIDFKVYFNLIWVCGCVCVMMCAGVTEGVWGSLGGGVSFRGYVKEIHMVIIVIIVFMVFFSSIYLN